MECEADFMDPLTQPRRAFHLALLAKTHVSTLVTICLESIGGETKERRNVTYVPTFEGKKERKRDGRRGRVAGLIVGTSSKSRF